MPAVPIGAAVRAHLQASGLTLCCLAGFECFVVGGALRDLLLGNEPKDFDLLTTATPKQVRSWLVNLLVLCPFEGSCCTLSDCLRWAVSRAPT